MTHRESDTCWQSIFNQERLLLCTRVVGVFTFVSKLLHLFVYLSLIFLTFEPSEAFKGLLVTNMEAGTTVASELKSECNGNHPTADAEVQNGKKTKEESVVDTITPREQKRFEKAFPKDFQAKINAYLAWRKEHGLENKDATKASPPNNHTATDSDLWNWAVRKAWEHQKIQNSSTCGDTVIRKDSLRRKMKRNQRNNASQETISTAEDEELEKHSSRGTSYVDEAISPPSVSQIVYCHKENGQCFHDKQGHVLFHILGAQLDTSVPNASSFYTTAVALYLDCLLDRHTDDRVTILLDVRPGRGWPNPPALELVGLVRHVATHLQALYPERLQHCLLFPIPRPAIFIWNLCKVFLHPSVRDAVTLVAGNASSANSPLPRNELIHYVDEHIVDHCERFRLDNYRA